MTTASFKHMLLICFILLSSVACDQTTKVAARTYLHPSETISYLGGFFQLQYVENPGAFLSLGATLHSGIRHWLLTVLTGFIAAALFGFLLLKREIRPSLVIGLSLITGGAIGNLIDRLFNNGSVIDFMNIVLGSVRTGVFNVADMAIMLGEGILLVLLSQRSRTIMRDS